MCCLIWTAVLEPSAARHPVLQSAEASPAATMASTLRSRLGLRSRLLNGDGRGAAFVVAPVQLRDPPRGEPNPADSFGGESAVRDQVECGSTGLPGSACSRGSNVEITLLLQMRPKCYRRLIAAFFLILSRSASRYNKQKTQHYV